MPFVFNAWSKAVALVAGGNSFNALLGKMALALPIFVSQLFPSCGKQPAMAGAHLNSSWKPCFPPFPPSCRVQCLFWGHWVSLLDKLKVLLTLKYSWAALVIFLHYYHICYCNIYFQAATEEAKHMMIGTNVFLSSTEGLTESIRMSSNVCTILYLISYYFFQDPQEI